MIEALTVPEVAVLRTLVEVQAQNLSRLPQGPGESVKFLRSIADKLLAMGRQAFPAEMSKAEAR